MNIFFKKVMTKQILIFCLVLFSEGVYAESNVLGYLEQQFGKKVSSPHPTKIAAQGNIIVAFSPKNGVTDAVVNQINKAHDVILVSAYSFSSKDIAQALLKAKQRGVEIKLILDKGQFSHSYSSSKLMFYRRPAICS